MSKPQTVHVVGSGLIGPLTAVFLAKKGFQVELYERRSDMRKEEMSAGKSINLVITDRGLEALDKVGLREQIMEITTPMKGRMLHDIEGETTFVPYGQKDNEVINAVSRGLLNCKLMDAAEAHDNVTIHFSHCCTNYDPEGKILTFTDEESGKETTVQADVVIGSDGAFSAIRRAMLGSIANFDYSQDFLEHGYKELVIPAAGDGGFQIGKDYLHIWPRSNYMLIAIPDLGGSFTVTLFYPYEGKDSFANLKTESDVTEFFEREFPDAVPLIPNLAKEFFQNPTGALATIRCNPWHIGGQALVMGDAAHAIVPFFGQGMNCGFEDCTALGELLTDDNHPDWEDVFSKFNKERKPNTDAIANMALENFVEMLSTTADPKFQLKKKVGFELEKRYPDQFIPRYSMVMFHPEIPYAEAMRRSKIQDNILNALCADIDAPEQTDWEKADNLVKSA